ncbi:hypothetical protein ACFV06_34920 [Streptomyces sp. NPDC059618]|uniref:hypothetical protein n=1 Tax=Streptomyces sp. NPDC059618 TaxID=3346887 RepID=UPI0036CF380E
MERISDGQIASLVKFLLARISDEDSFRERGADRSTSALRLVVNRQVAAVRYYRACPPETAAASELHATASWNLLVTVSEVWRDHVDFPADAAMETFEFDADNPLAPEV